MKVTIAQINTTNGDIAGNVAKIVAAIEKARSDGSDLVVFPEVVTHGYTSQDWFQDADIINAAGKPLDDIILATKGITAVIGTIRRNDSHDGRRLHRRGTHGQPVRCGPAAGDQRHHGEGDAGTGEHASAAAGASLGFTIVRGDAQLLDEIGIDGGHAVLVGAGPGACLGAAASGRLSGRHGRVSGIRPRVSSRTG